MRVSITVHISSEYMLCACVFLFVEIEHAGKASGGVKLMGTVMWVALSVVENAIRYTELHP